MATVRTIDDIQPIPGADRIEVAKLGGWQSIVTKNKYKVGEKVVYAEIDSAIPLNETIDSDGSLAKRGSKTLDGVEYHILKTVKLRGTISQGLVFPLSVLGEYAEAAEVGDDVSEILGIIKYDPFEPKWIIRGGTGQDKLAKLKERDKNIIGSFPTEFARKTDSERVQNLTNCFSELKKHNWVATEKIDGQSITLINDGGKVRVATRNWEVENHPAKDWAIANGFLRFIPEGWAVQGEWAGPKVQNNRLGLSANRLFVFSLWKDGQLTDWRMNQWTVKYSVPIIGVLTGGELQNVDSLIQETDGMKTLLSGTPGVEAEGIVFHENDGRVLECLGLRSTFKVINNSFLLGE